MGLFISYFLYFSDIYPFLLSVSVAVAGGSLPPFPHGGKGGGIGGFGGVEYALLFEVQTSSSRASRASQRRKRNNKSSFVAALAYSRLRERNNNFFFVAPIYSCRAFVRQEYEGISGFVRRGGAALVLALLLCGWLSVKASRGRILARSHTATASPDLVCAVGACVRCGLSFGGARSALPSAPVGGVLHKKNTTDL